MKIHTQFATKANFFSLSQHPPVAKNEDISMFKFRNDKLGKKVFPYVSCPHATKNFIFLNWRPMQSGKLQYFVKVCKCGMLCVNFRSVGVYSSAVMVFWPLPLEQLSEFAISPTVF